MSNPYNPKDPIFYMVARHKLMSTTVSYETFNRSSEYGEANCPNIPGMAECKLAWDEGKLQMAGIVTTRHVAEHRNAMLLGACMDKFFFELEANKLADEQFDKMQLH